jgi:hypothetical protein
LNAFRQRKAAQGTKQRNRWTEEGHEHLPLEDEVEDEEEEEEDDDEDCEVWKEGGRVGEVESVEAYQAGEDRHSTESSKGDASTGTSHLVPDTTATSRCSPLFVSGMA